MVEAARYGMRQLWDRITCVQTIERLLRLYLHLWQPPSICLHRLPSTEMMVHYLGNSDNCSLPSIVLSELVVSQIE